MKKLLSIVLAVVMVVSVAVISAGAYNSDGDYSVLFPGSNYSATKSYTVDAKVPYSEDAVLACGGDLSNTQKMYFQAPEDWANQFNTFAGPDDSEPYPHICAYWWSGIGSSWSDTINVQWVGYQAHLVDKANRIYCIQMPNDGDSPMVTWNNGVNAGMDETAPIFKFGRQIMDANTEGADVGEYDTLPEGSPTIDDFDGCIQIIDYTVSTPNPLTGFDSYGSKWYVYYGNGCYGMYSQDSANYVSRQHSCCNPEHHHCDVDLDGTVDSVDVTAMMRDLVEIQPLSAEGKAHADADKDNYFTIMDATRIQRYEAEMCNIDGSKPYAAAKNAYLENAAIE